MYNWLLPAPIKPLISKSSLTSKTLAWVLLLTLHSSIELADICHIFLLLIAFPCFYDVAHSIVLCLLLILFQGCHFPVFSYWDTFLYIQNHCLPTGFYHFLPGLLHSSVCFFLLSHLPSRLAEFAFMSLYVI